MRIIGSSKGEHCLYPFQIDPIYNGCTHDCKYCYAANIQHMYGRSFDQFKETDTQLLRKRLENPRGAMGEFIKRKHPLRIGAMSDPFMRGLNVEKTYEVLDILNEFEYPHIIITKSHDICDAMDHLNPKLAQIQISGSISDKLCKAIEPGASVTSERIAACEILSDNGFRVMGRIGPIIPIWADGAPWMEDNIVCEGVDFSIPEKFERAGAAGLILEMIRLTPWMRKNMQAAGINIDATITDESVRKNATVFYSLETRKRYYETLSYTGLPVTYCDMDMWNTATDGDCCQFAAQM